MKRTYTLNNERFTSESEHLSNAHWRKENDVGFRAEKQSYFTKQSAKRALKELGKGMGLNVYKCPVCGYYHLGHKKRS